MDGFTVQFYLHIMDALYLRHLLDTNQSSSNNTEYELCFCKFLVYFLPENFAYLIFLPFFLQGNHRWSYCICLVSFASIFFTVYFDVRICGCSVWYFAAAHKHYTGPKSNLNDDSVIPIDQDIQTKGWKCCGMTQKINIIQGASGTRIEHRVGGRSAAGFFFVYILGYGSIFFRSKSAVEVISAWKIYKSIEFLSQLLHPRNHWGERCHGKSEHYWPWQLLIGRRVKFLNPAEYSSSTQTAPKRSRRNSSESPPAA